MKKIVLGILALSMFVLTTNAQETRKMKQHGPHHRNSMMKELNLSEAQKEQIKSNRESFKEQMIELEKNENITVKEYRKRKASILKSQKDQTDRVLTEEQKKQIAEYKIEQQKKQELHSARKLDKMKSSLNLSNEQVNQIKADRMDNNAKMKAIKENSQLTQSEKKEQIIELKESQENSLLKVLTPEQINKMEESKKDRMDKQSRN